MVYRGLGIRQVVSAEGGGGGVGHGVGDLCHGDNAVDMGSALWREMFFMICE